jgi:signal transduction histidine kinase
VAIFPPERDISVSGALSLADGARPETSSVWGAGALAFALTLAAALIGLLLQDARVAVFWPAAGVVAGLMLAVPRGPARVGVALGAALAFSLGHLLHGRDPITAGVFIAGNLAQPLLMAAVLERGGRRVRLDTLPRAGTFLAVALAAAAVTGLAMAFGLTATGHAEAPAVRVWELWVTGHGVALVTVAPALFALGDLVPDRARTLLDTRLPWLQLGLLGLAAWLLLGGLAPGDALGMIGAFGVLYAMLLWIAASNPPVWPSLALLLVGIVTVVQTVRGVGLFSERTDEAQVFLLVASLWTLSLGAIVAQLRVALTQALESEERMRDAIDIGGAIPFEWDRARDLVVGLDRRQRLSLEESRDADAFFERVHPADRAALRARIQALTPAQPSYVARYRYRHPDGRTLWLEDRGRASFDAQGRQLRVRGLTADITERHADEEALRQSDRMKDRFIAVLSHELRNPLAPIRNAVALLRRMQVPDQQQQWCHDVIERQVGHMAYLLDELLDVSRLTQGKLRLSLEPVVLDVLLDRALELVRPAIEANGCRLAIDRPEEDVRLLADPVRLVQVLANLIGNAAKYSERGGLIVLSAWVLPPRDGANAGAELRLSVRDSGVGIAPGNLERVFDMFWQLEPRAGHAYGGLGIGLWLVRQIAGLHGGSIEARSDGIGRGSEFVVRLPLPEAASEGAAQAPVLR